MAVVITKLLLYLNATSGQRAALHNTELTIYLQYYRLISPVVLGCFYTVSSILSVSGHSKHSYSTWIRNTMSFCVRFFFFCEHTLILKTEILTKLVCHSRKNRWYKEIHKLVYKNPSKEEQESMVEKRSCASSYKYKKRKGNKTQAGIHSI